MKLIQLATYKVEILNLQSSNKKLKKRKEKRVNLKEIETNK